MVTPVLTTKLYVPPSRPRVVGRPRLIERLNSGVHGNLTLVSAPAGFGKTSLVSEWLSANHWCTAWLSLDEGDSDPARFMMYLIAALETAAPGVGGTVSATLELSQPPPIDSVLTSLLNVINARQDRTVLVLDDYHLVDSRPVNEAVAFLLEHMPPLMHLVITTREDPQLPLARLRARGQMTELRAADLRFTPQEAATFLNEVMGLDLAERDVATLETRTESWIAGLQLAALSIHGQDDLPGFIEAFAGNDRYIVDYLVEEVLQRQPPHLRAFLLRTSILDRLSGPLCDAITDRTDSQKHLETLEHSNLFVIPLDEKRHWYRYHHLFAEVLRAYLADEQAEGVAALHVRASAWFQHHEMPHDAVRHALAGEDFERAADLITMSVSAMSQSRQEVTVLSWLRALPDDVIRVRPVLSAFYAGVLLQIGSDLEGAESRLLDAEQWLQPAGSTTTPGATMVVEDDAAFRRLPAQITIYHAGIALIRSDITATVQYARQALELLPEDDDFGRGAATGLLGLAYWTSGDLEAGYRMYTECMARLLRAGFVPDTFGCALVLADIRITQGRLHDALATYERALERAAMHSSQRLRGVADMHVGMSRVHRERNDLDAALFHLQASKELGEHNGLPQNPYRWCVGMARIRDIQGDVPGAILLLREAERLYVGDFSPNVRPVAAMMARMWVRGGNQGEALAWVHDRGLTTRDALSYLHEYEHITLARVLLAQDEPSISDAQELLERLLDAAEAGGRAGSVIEILILQACTYEAQDAIEQALVPLQRALSLASPEGHVRLFVDEGAPIARLLAEVHARDFLPGYTGMLLAAHCSEEQEPADHASPSMFQPLEEPLSRRELEVIRLISQGRSNKEISDTLFLAIDTVKGHNRRIFRKLGGQSRTEAVARAREIGLL
jgi:LuxR family transcriptional regulator, maltose regulon positive regulatory protein